MPPRKRLKRLKALRPRKRAKKIKSQERKNIRKKVEEDILLTLPVQVNLVLAHDLGLLPLHRVLPDLILADHHENAGKRIGRLRNEPFELTSISQSAPVALN